MNDSTETMAAVMVAAFSRLEQNVLNIAYVLVVLFALGILALVAAIYFERRQQRKTAQLVADVQARIDGGVLR